LRVKKQKGESTALKPYKLVPNVAEIIESMKQCGKEVVKTIVKNEKSQIWTKAK